MREHQKFLFGEMSSLMSQYNSDTVEVTNGETTNGQEQVVIPEDKEEPIEHSEQVNPEDDQYPYIRRHRSAPARYGIDEYVDAAFLGAGQMEEPKSIEEALKSKEWKEAVDCYQVDETQ